MQSELHAKVVAHMRFQTGPIVQISYLSLNVAQRNHPAVVTSDDAMSDLVVPCARGPRRKGHAVHTLSLLGCTPDQEVALCAKEVRWTRHIIFWALRRRSERINPTYCSFGPIGFLHVFFQIYFVALPTVPLTLDCWPQGTSVLAGAKNLSEVFVHDKQ